MERVSLGSRHSVIADANPSWTLACLCGKHGQVRPIHARMHVSAQCWEKHAQRSHCFSQSGNILDLGGERKRMVRPCQQTNRVLTVCVWKLLVINSDHAGQPGNTQRRRYGPSCCWSSRRWPSSRDAMPSQIKIGSVQTAPQRELFLCWWICLSADQEPRFCAGNNGSKSLRLADVLHLKVMFYAAQNGFQFWKVIYLKLLSSKFEWVALIDRKTLSPF